MFFCSTIDIPLISPSVPKSSYYFYKSSLLPINIISIKDAKFDYFILLNFYLILLIIIVLSYVIVGETQLI